MNAMEWLRAVQENPEKRPIPLVPPDGGLQKTSGNIGIPPVPPRNSKHFLENENNLEGNKPERREIYWGDEPEPGSSGGNRGNQGFFREKGDSSHQGDRGEQAKAAVAETAPSPTKPRKPFLTPGGDLSIPFDSDPKYHWWIGGQSVAQTRAEVLAWIRT
jgi:hypothetical protein